MDGAGEMMEIGDAAPTTTRTSPRRCSQRAPKSAKGLTPPWTGTLSRMTTRGRLEAHRLDVESGVHGDREKLDGRLARDFVPADGGPLLENNLGKSLVLSEGGVDVFFVRLVAADCLTVALMRRRSPCSRAGARSAHRVVEKAS